MSIAVGGGSVQQRAELAKGLEENLRPAFRRTMICGDDVSGGVRGALSPWLAKVRSTLVIRKKDTTEAQWSEQDEIRFEFRGAQVGVTTWERCVPIDGSQSSRQNLEYATRVTLEWLAARLQRRMRTEEPSSAKPVPERRASGAA